MSKIKTTHVGSLPRSNDLSELLFKKDKKEEIDSIMFDEIVKRDVNNIVKIQINIGIDFDNTLVNYDRSFYELAIEKELIPPSLEKSKYAVRSFLRERGKDEKFSCKEVHSGKFSAASTSPERNLIAIFT